MLRCVLLRQEPHPFQRKYTIRMKPCKAMGPKPCKACVPPPPLRSPGSSFLSSSGRVETLHGWKGPRCEAVFVRDEFGRSGGVSGEQKGVLLSHWGWGLV